MKNFLKFSLLLLAMGLFMRSSWVLSGMVCPVFQPPQPGPKIDQGTFLKAHGIPSQENYSIWLKEHSVWRKKYKNELKNYSFIPQPGDTKRQQ